MPYCPKCGERVSEDDVFCSKCGARLARELGDLKGTPSAAVKAPETKNTATQVVSAQIPKAKKEGEEIQRQLETGIEVKMGFFPLAFLLFLCTPTVVVDDRAYRKSWGTHFFELEPGRHTIKIFFHYLFMPECGANSIDVIVEEGKIGRIKYYMPPWMLARGSIKTEQTTVTARMPKGPITKQATTLAEVPRELLTKKPTAAGILSILAGVTELIMGISLTLAEGGPFGLFVASGIIAVVGGVCALRRKKWGLALAGAICSLVAFPFGIPAIILVALSRGEFKLLPGSPIAVKTPSLATTLGGEERRRISEKAQTKKAAPPTPVPRKKAAPPAKTVEVDGVTFPITSDVDKFCEIAATNRACVMLINTKDYAQITQKAFSYFSNKFGGSSDFTKAVSSARLICSGCKWEFPGSYTLSLMDPKVFGGKFIGATPGYQEFGLTGRCPRCGSGQSLYIYDNPPTEEITQSDVNAIREYWRHLAQQWWKTESRTEGICDSCNALVPRDAGYLCGSWLLCENCCNRRLGPSVLEQLRQNPDYFGAGLLRKVRHFAANK